jgi:acid ceramidase
MKGAISMPGGASPFFSKGTAGVPQIDIDLSLPPAARWQPLHAFSGQARQLLEQYMRDLGSIEPFRERILFYRDASLDAEYAAELASIARLLDVSEEAALMGNLYYDLLKFVLGCTAFAVDTEYGPLHARNLDWWTEMGLLARATLVANFRGAAAGPFQVVSWPGFTGALSGLAPGRFAITLNAVLSDDPPALATPITYLIRSVFETAATFAEAVDRLASTEIVSDCLLLVTGVQPGEMVVIERTPTRAAFRSPEHGRLIVTNDYLALPSKTTTAGTEQELQRTSCSRFDRASLLLREHMPGSVGGCFHILTDPAVRMGITVQHMVMSAAQGLLEVRLPAVYR